MNPRYLVGFALATTVACTEESPPKAETADAAATPAPRDAAVTTTMTDDGGSNPGSSSVAESNTSSISKDALDSGVPTDAQSENADAQVFDASLDGGDDAGDAGTTTPDTDASTPDAGDAAVEDVAFILPRGGCNLGTRVGGFFAESQEQFGVVQGSIEDGVKPNTVPRVALESGQCTLYEKRTMVCVPACQAGELCGEGGECITHPAPVNVGQVVITGLTKETVINPPRQGSTYLSPGADNPPFIDQSEIILSANGSDEVPSFHMFGIGSTRLTDSPNWVLAEDDDLAIEWTAGSSNTTILVELTIDQHGTSPLSLSCEFDDTGAATVPSALINQLIGAGVSGFPNGRLVRRTLDHVELPFGCIDFSIGSPRSADVSVSGFTPCYETDDCPDGQTCNTALEQCE